MRIFKAKGFVRFQRRERIADQALVATAGRMNDGLIDADLGSGLVKQRVARTGQGKSGGFRTVIAYRRGDRAVFLFGFAKNDIDSIDDHELHIFKRRAQALLAMNGVQLSELIATGDLTEIENEEAG